MKKQLEIGDCKDCGDSTFDHPRDYYMVKCWVWNKYADGTSYRTRRGAWDEEKLSGMLCMACLETRMGRKLRPSDLMLHVSINYWWYSFFGMALL